MDLKRECSEDWSACFLRAHAREHAGEQKDEDCRAKSGARRSNISTGVVAIVAAIGALAALLLTLQHE